MKLKFFIFIFLWQISGIGICQKQYSAEEIKIRNELIKKYGNKNKEEETQLRNQVLSLENQIAENMQTLKSHKNQLNKIISSESSNTQIKNMLSKNTEYIQAIEDEFSEVVTDHGSSSMASLVLYKERLTEFNQKVEEYTSRLTGAKKAVLNVNGSNSSLDKKLDDVAGSLANFGSTDNVEENVFTKLLGQNAKVAVAQMLKQNPFAGMSKQELRDMFTVQMAATGIGKVAKNNPKLLNVLVEIFHDKDAVPKFVSIVNEGKKIKLYGVIVICVFVASFIIGFINSKANFFKRLFYKIMTMLLAICINFSAFYFIFKEQVGPTIKAAIRGFTL